jgi:hypothetical protein
MLELKERHQRQLKQLSKRFKAKKKKIETPILAELENILLQHNISAAAYHGGKPNGVNCCEFIQHSSFCIENLKLICFLLLMLKGVVMKL